MAKDDFVYVNVDDILMDSTCQARPMNGSTVYDYAERMKEGLSFPPVTIFKDDAGVLWLADGFHRVAATKEAGLDKVRAQVHPGDQRKAILYSLGPANAEHGLPLTRADRAKRVERILSDPEWSQWSDRQIANYCGVSHPTVARFRELTGKFSSERKTADGRVMNTDGINANRHWGLSNGNPFWAQVLKFRLDRDTILEQLQPGATHLTDLTMSKEDCWRRLDQLATETVGDHFPVGSYVKNVNDGFGQVKQAHPTSLSVLDKFHGNLETWPVDICVPCGFDEWNVAEPKDYTRQRRESGHWAERRDYQNLFWGQVNRNGLDQATILEKLQPGAKVLTDLAAGIEEIEKLLNRIAIEEHSAVWKRGDYVRFKTEVSKHYGQVVECAPDYMIVISLRTGMEQAWAYRHCQLTTREEWEQSKQQAEQPPGIGETPAPPPEPEPESEPEQIDKNCFIPDLPRRQVEFIMALHTGAPVARNAATRLALRGHGLITQDDDWDAIRLTPCGQQAAAAYDLVPIEEVDELRAGPEPEIDYTRLSLADYQADDLVEIMPALARVLAYCEGYDVPADDDLAAAAWQVFRFFDQVTEMVAEEQQQAVS